jgi:hypothetical protein
MLVAGHHYQSGAGCTGTLFLECNVIHAYASLGNFRTDFTKLHIGRKVLGQIFTFEFSTNFHRKAADKCVSDHFGLNS